MIIFRFEEVAAGDIRRIAGLGCHGPNDSDTLGHVGMALCQGRYCGLSATQILSDTNKISPDETRYYPIRLPL